MNNNHTLICYWSNISTHFRLKLYKVKLSFFYKILHNITSNRRSFLIFQTSRREMISSRIGKWIIYMKSTLVAVPTLIQNTWYITWGRTPIIIHKINNNEDNLEIPSTDILLILWNVTTLHWCCKCILSASKHHWNKSFIFFMVKMIYMYIH